MDTEEDLIVTDVETEDAPEDDQDTTVEPPE